MGSSHLAPPMLGPHAPPPPPLGPFKCSSYYTEALLQQFHMRKRRQTDQTVHPS